MRPWLGPIALTKIGAYVLSGGYLGLAPVVPGTENLLIRASELAAISAPGKGDYIVLDIDSHASIWDGCKLGDAEVVPFKHNDIEAMDKRLGRIPEGAGKLVILEGVYSMMGDIAPLKEMIAVAKKHGAMVLVDEAHSMGFIGPNGRGVAEDQGCLDDVDFVIGTFSKSVGTVGDIRLVVMSGLMVADRLSEAIRRIEELIGPVVMLASNAGSFVNGSVIVVDGALDALVA